MISPVTRLSLFQSTLPARGATGESYETKHEVKHISIHAPRTGSDDDLVTRMYAYGKFQSTLPARGATQGFKFRGIDDVISIHAPRTGSDQEARAKG